MEDIQAILQAYPPEQRFSLAMLQDMQHKFNYIPREGMEALAAYLGCPLSSLYAMFVSSAFIVRSSAAESIAASTSAIGSLLCA